MVDLKQDAWEKKPELPFDWAEYCKQHNYNHLTVVDSKPSEPVSWHVVVFVGALVIAFLILV